MEDFAVHVRMFTVSEMHRPLFHPLAAVRHRTWAGPETKEQNKTKHLSVAPTDGDCIHTMNTQAHLCLSSVTYLLLSRQFFSQWEAHFSILAPGRRSVYCSCPRSNGQHEQMYGVRCRNDNKLLNEVNFRFSAFVVKQIVTASIEKSSRSYRVRKKLLSAPTKLKHVNTDQRKTFRRMRRIQVSVPWRAHCDNKRRFLLTLEVEPSQIQLFLHK
jgi:hypothetical protein